MEGAPANRAHSNRSKRTKKLAKKNNSGNVSKISSGQSVGVLNVHIAQLLPHFEVLSKMKKYGSVDPVFTEKFIPFLRPLFMKGTQIVEIRLTLSIIKITVASGVAYTTVASISANSFYNFSDCANLFDEYRVIRGDLEYYASYPNVTNMCWGGAAVDYSISTAFGSFDAMDAHDTKRIGSFNQFASYDKGKARFHWPMQFELAPDQDWIPTTTNGTVFCYWKPFILSGTIASSEDTGSLLGHMDFQFRGLAG